MALVGWLWLSSPLVLVAVIAENERLRGLIAAHHRNCRIAGWTGVVMMCVGAALIHTLLGGMMFWIGTPLAGLAVWSCRDDGDDGFGDGPDIAPIDWDAFEREFWTHVRRGPRRRGRVPSR